MQVHHIKNKSSADISPEINDLVEVELDEVPTSGYKWALGEMNNNEIELVSEDYHTYPEAGIGGGGSKKFTFRVLKKAAGIITIENRQPWSGGEVGKIFQLHYS